MEVAFESVGEGVVRPPPPPRLQVESEQKGSLISNHIQWRIYRHSKAGC